MTPRPSTALRRRLPSADDAGFTILEVLVAFTLFTIVSLTATVAIVNSLNAAHSSQQRIDAANVAASIIATTQNQTQTAVNGTTPFTASVKQSEDFSVVRTITFNNGATTCSTGASFVVNVVVRQTQTNKFLARSDSVITC